MASVSQPQAQGCHWSHPPDAIYAYARHPPQSVALRPPVGGTPRIGICLVPLCDRRHRVNFYRVYLYFSLTRSVVASAYRSEAPLPAVTSDSVQAYDKLACLRWHGLLVEPLGGATPVSDNGHASPRDATHDLAPTLPRARPNHFRGASLPSDWPEHSGRFDPRHRGFVCPRLGRIGGDGDDSEEIHRCRP